MTASEVSHGVVPAPRRGIGALITATGVSVIGDGVIGAAIPLLALSVTRDPIALSAVNAANYLPWLALGLLVGVLTDRWPRRLTMMSADIIRFVLLACLAVAVMGGWITVPLLITIVLLVGCAQCFFDSAGQAIVPALVGTDPERLTRVNSRIWSLDTIGRQLAGPPAGSAMFAAVPSLPFAVDAISFLASALILRRIPPVPKSSSREHPRIAEAINDGIKHIAHTPALRLAVTHVVIFNLGFNAGYAVLVLFTAAVLSLSSLGFGILIAVMAVGAIGGSQVAPFLARRLPTIVLYGGALIVGAAGWLAVGLSTNILITGTGLVAVGASAILSSVIVGTQRQLHTPNEILGRVVSTFKLAGIGAAGIGSLAGGVIAEAFGLRAPFMIGLVLLPIAAGAFFFLRKPT